MAITPDMMQVHMTLKEIAKIGLSASYKDGIYTIKSNRTRIHVNDPDEALEYARSIKQAQEN